MEKGNRPSSAVRKASIAFLRAVNTESELLELRNEDIDRSKAFTNYALITNLIGSRNLSSTFIVEKILETKKLYDKLTDEQKNFINDVYERLFLYIDYGELCSVLRTLHDPLTISLGHPEVTDKIVVDGATHDVISYIAKNPVLLFSYLALIVPFSSVKLMFDTRNIIINEDIY